MRKVLLSTIALCIGMICSTQEKEIDWNLHIPRAVMDSCKIDYPAYGLPGDCYLMVV